MKLKMNILWLLMLLCLPFVSSCKEDLPAYGEAEITKVGFYHKYYGPDKDGLTGENISVNKELQCRYTIDNDAATVDCIVTVPAADNKYTESIRAEVSQSKLAGYMKVSTAAHVIPIEDAPTLGVPGDWTHTNKYVVKAADGTEKVWTVRITEFKK